MRLAVIGLGRMGANISLRLMRAGHEIVGFDRNLDNVAALIGEGAARASSLEDAFAKLAAPRIFWVMLPAGKATEETVASLRATTGRRLCLVSAFDPLRTSALPSKMA